MSYKNLVKDYLKKEYPDISDNTIKLYSTKIAQLNTILNDDGDFDSKFKFLNDYNKVFESIKNLNNDNKLAFLNAIVFILKNKELNDIYRNEREIYYRKKRELKGDNYKPENFINYVDMLEKTPAPDFNDPLSKVLNDMILWVQIRYPLRLSMWNMKIIRVKKDQNPKNNYLYISKNKMEFLMNDFKNIKSMGPQIIPISAANQKVIKDYLRFLTAHEIKHSNLLLNFYNKKVDTFNSVDAFSRVLKKLLAKVFPNKNITTNDIRSSYETDLMGSPAYRHMTNTEREKLHNHILHTLSTANANYFKV